MNLIEIYIQEVVRRLPEKNREDIALELRSTIEDMLPDGYGEEDVKEVLGKMGSPVALANGYLDRPMHLIGPRYFDLYVTLLKMIFPIAAVIALISTVAQSFIGYGGEALINVIIDVISFGVSVLVEVAIQVFFWLTLVFAIIERVDNGKENQPLTMSLKKWTPEDLENIAYIPKKKAISKFEVFGSLLWTAIWATLYFYAHHFIGIYEGKGDRLDFVTPSFNQEVLLQYWPIVVLVICFEIALSLYKLVKGQWTTRMATLNMTLQIIATIVFIVIFINPNLLNQDFLTYMADLFTISTNQFESWIIGGGIFFFIVGAVINAYDGIRKGRLR